MNVQQMRTAILFVYPHFKSKLNNMKDDQIQAIYFRLKKTGQIK